VARSWNVNSTIGAGAGDGPTTVGEALQLGDEILAGEIVGAERRALPVAEVGVDIDHGRHHGLAGQIDADRAWRRRQLALPADADERAVLDHERGALDHRGVADDEPGAPSKKTGPDEACVCA
jgi:hypothetical protein